MISMNHWLRPSSKIPAATRISFPKWSWSCCQTTKSAQYPQRIRWMFISNIVCWWSSACVPIRMKYAIDKIASHPSSWKDCKFRSSDFSSKWWSSSSIISVSFFSNSFAQRINIQLTIMQEGCLDSRCQSRQHWQIGVGTRYRDALHWSEANDGRCNVYVRSVRRRNLSTGQLAVIHASGRLSVGRLPC